MSKDVFDFDHYRSRHAFQAMTGSTALQRFSELLQAFVLISTQRGDVHVRGSAAPPPLGFAVRIQPGPRAAGVELALTLGEARITVWSDDGGSPPDITLARTIELDLTSGFRWDCLLFPDADTLAVTLLRRMDDALTEAGTPAA